MSLVASLACRKFRHSLAILGVCGSLSLPGGLPASAPALAGDGLPAAPPRHRPGHPPPRPSRAVSRSRCRSRRRRSPVPIGYIRQFRVTRGPPPASMSSRSMPALPAPRWPSTKTTPAASSPGTSTASMSRTVGSADKAVRGAKAASTADTITSWSTHRPTRCSSLSDWAKGKDVLLLQHPRHRRFAAPGRIAAPTSCISCRTATCWPTRWPNISSLRNGPIGCWCTARRRATSLMPTRSSAPPARFGATIVDAREYKDNSGGRRDDVGTIPPGKQASSDAALRRRSRLPGHHRRRRGSVVRPVYALSRRRRRAARRRHHRSHRHHLEPRPREMGRDPGQQSFREGLSAPDAADRLSGLCRHAHHRRGRDPQRTARISPPSPPSSTAPSSSSRPSRASSSNTGLGTVSSGSRS